MKPTNTHFVAYVPSFRIALPPEPTIIITKVAEENERIKTTSSHDVIGVLLAAEQVMDLEELQELYIRKEQNLRTRSTDRKVEKREIRLKQLEGRIDFIKRNFAAS